MKRLRNSFFLWWYRTFKPAPRGPLQALENGKPQAVQPTGVCGLHLVVSGNSASRLVSSQQTIDPENFWRWWRHLGGEAMIDEDGDLFVPWR